MLLPPNLISDKNELYQNFKVYDNKNEIIAKADELVKRISEIFLDKYNANLFYKCIDKQFSLVIYRSYLAGLDYYDSFEDKTKEKIEEVGSSIFELMGLLKYSYGFEVIDFVDSLILHNMSMKIVSYNDEPVKIESYNDEPVKIESYNDESEKSGHLKDRLSERISSLWCKNKLVKYMIIKNSRFRSLFIKMIDEDKEFIEVISHISKKKLNSFKERLYFFNGNSITTVGNILTSLFEDKKYETLNNFLDKLEALEERKSSDSPPYSPPQKTHHIGEQNQVNVESNYDILSKKISEFQFGYEIDLNAVPGSVRAEIYQYINVEICRKIVKSVSGLYDTDYKHGWTGRLFEFWKKKSPGIDEVLKQILVAEEKLGKGFSATYHAIALINKAIQEKKISASKGLETKIEIPTEYMMNSESDRKYEELVEEINTSSLFKEHTLGFITGRDFFRIFKATSISHLTCEIISVIAKDAKAPSYSKMDYENTITYFIEWQKKIPYLTYVFLAIVQAERVQGKKFDDTYLRKMIDKAK